MSNRWKRLDRLSLARPCTNCAVMQPKLHDGLCRGCARRVGVVHKALSPWEKAQMRQKGTT